MVFPQTIYPWGCPWRYFPFSTIHLLVSRRDPQWMGWCSVFGTGWFFLEMFHVSSKWFQSLQLTPLMDYIRVDCVHVSRLYINSINIHKFIYGRGEDIVNWNLMYIIGCYRHPCLVNVTPSFRSYERFPPVVDVTTRRQLPPRNQRSQCPAKSMSSEVNVAVS